MFKSLLTGEIIIHPSCWSLAAKQIVDFNALKTSNVDDILDCITYIPKVLTEFSNKITIHNMLQSGDSNEVMPIEETCFF